MTSEAIQSETGRLETRLRRLDAEARDRGFSTPAAFLKWCLRRGIQVFQPDGRVRFVDAAAVDAAIRAGASESVAPPAPRPAKPHAALAQAARAHVNRYRSR